MNESGVLCVFVLVSYTLSFLVVLHVRLIMIILLLMFTVILFDF